LKPFRTRDIAITKAAKKGYYKILLCELKYFGKNKTYWEKYNTPYGIALILEFGSANIANNSTVQFTLSHHGHGLAGDGPGADLLVEDKVGEGEEDSLP
jgi:hypothetical protein